MSNLLYVVAIILIIGWAIGVFFYSVGSLIHILLVLAVIAILIKIISGRGTSSNP
ncbi:MAG: lmo0937 family membrane protein [Syntrophothermus sp.]